MFQGGAVMKSLGEEFKERKKELGITTEQLSRLSGIPIGTINKILNGAGQRMTE